MPIGEDQIPYKEMEELVNSHKFKCGECDSELNLCWGGAYGYDCYILRCSNDITHSTIKRPHHLGPYDIPGFNLYNLTKGRTKMVSERFGEEAGTKLAKYQGVVSLTKPQATEILRTIYGDAPETEMQRAVLLCVSCGLNPLMNHVFLIKFYKWNKDHTKITGEEWATIIGIKAKRLLASRRHGYSYIDDTPRVMTDKEQIKVFGEPDPTKLWVITKLQDEAGNVSVGYGFWPTADKPYGTEKGNTKFNMAAIRSESQALDRMAPGEMPVGVEAMTEEVAEAMSKVKVGEVSEVSEGGAVEGEFREVEETPAPAPENIGKDVTEAEAQPITPEQLKELDALLVKAGVENTALGKYCNKDKGWNIKTKADLKRGQFKELKEAIGRGLETPPEK